MEKRVNTKIETYISDFKKNICKKINEILASNNFKLNSKNKSLDNSNSKIKNTGLPVSKHCKQKNLKSLIEIYQEAPSLKANKPW